MIYFFLAPFNLYCTSPVPFHSAPCTAAVQHPAARAAGSHAGFPAQPVLRGRRVAHAVRQVAQGCEYRTHPGRQAAHREECVDAGSGDRVGELYVHCRLGAGGD